ncbi:GIY-YIG nuclease family protein [Pseudohaliea rubra]|uniref:Excinuclease cho n=1 Tax=Pseudohaliea rubra DSM 19751 TaxID=1265313 RepID=A0A095VPS6_9GAMM|nr:GIY-YIG nuclease family protein [Pseudohaliea rubra]KGE03083.1 Excinuclease cho (excinuclease ABC alternative C subunit) [Pseudohaliea rubra DSM 19751]
MESPPDTIRLTRRGRPLAGTGAADLPACAGVYRFFDRGGALLYVGKSIDLRSRVSTHLRAARSPGREQRMLHALARIDCEPCAGELGALLRENAAIKAELPLYNRRQRRPRRLWTLQLTPGPGGFLQPAATCFPDGEALADAPLGLYHSEQQAAARLRTLARAEGLCVRVLGLEGGRGPCFQFQLRRCRGACAGKESAAAHNARLRAALADQRLAAWPFEDALLLEERALRPAPGQPRQQWHVIRDWSYLGSFTRRDSARRIAGARSGPVDRDTYHILLGALRRGAVALRCAATDRCLDNPFGGRPDRDEGAA